MGLAVASAVAFGTTHLYQGPAGVISTGAAGLLFGWVYLACGRVLLPAIAGHMTVNLIGVTMMFLGSD